MKKELKKIPSSRERFNQIIEDIKSVKIQGANAIARAGVEAYLLFPDKTHSKKIISARATEPLLQNFISILENSKDKEKTANQLMRYLDSSQGKINRAGYTLLKKDMKIFSHCSSSSVIGILRYAKQRGLNFTVYTTEVEPLLQGRKTAKILADLDIDVVVMPDLAAEQFLSKCDILLFGADAYTRREIVNKIGTSTLVKLAAIYNIPSYSVGVSLKYTREVSIEKRRPEEVWDEKHKNIRIENMAFDMFKGRGVTGIVSESGILPFNQFVKIAKINLRNLSKQL